MTDLDFASTNHHGVRAYRVTQFVLAVVALAQGIAVAMVWKDRSPLIERTQTEKPESSQEPVPHSIPVEPDPFSGTEVALLDPHPELRQPAGKEPRSLDPAEPVWVRPVVLAVAALDVPITDEVCLAHLDEGIYLRDRGDMMGALKELRQAQELVPEHPKLLYQLALTLDSMGQEVKASAHWRKLRLLGTEAGNYYQLALERLKEGGNLAPPADTVFEGEEVKQGRFLVSGVKVERMPETAQGEMLRFEATIERKQAEAAKVSSMEIKLHLFDEVNGQKIDRTTALPPVIQWLDAPVDWAEGRERFSFEYRQPPLSPDELVKIGQRKYYGYAVEFRYEGGQLQDLVAEPIMLGDLAKELPEGMGPVAPGERLDLSPSRSLPGQPDAVLFPGDKFDR